MAKLKLQVEIDREELVNLITDYALEKAGRPQGSSSVEFLFHEAAPAVVGCVVSFNGTPAKK